MWRHVIAVCERSLGPQHVATTAAMERLAESCAARGKLSEAGQLRAMATTLRDVPAAPSVRRDWLESDAVAPAQVPPIVLATGPTTQDALLAIQAELMAATGSRRRWPVFVAAAAVIIALGILTTQPGAARTFAVRPTKAPPTWEVWSSPAPVMTDSVVVPDSATFPVRLAAEAPMASTTGAAMESPLIHARLIGAPPQPALPGNVADRHVAGEVVVRFAVDAQGHPDTSSVTVIRTPHDELTEAVRRVIPEMRFEPARRGAAGAPAERDEVEMSFQFRRGAR
jgi:TonB family protein